MDPGGMVTEANRKWWTVGALVVALVIRGSVMLVTDPCVQEKVAAV
jgi:hypothetical protein